MFNSQTLIKSLVISCKFVRFICRNLLKYENNKWEWVYINLKSSSGVYEPRGEGNLVPTFIVQQFIWIYFKTIGSAMVSMLTSSALDRGFEPPVGSSQRLLNWYLLLLR